MKKIFILSVVGMLAIGCNNATSTEAPTIEVTSEEDTDALMKEVMVVHDKAMAQMSEMSQLRKKLREALNEAEDTSAYHNAYSDLAQAQEDMMEWMRNFENPDKMEVSEEEKAQYLEEQKEKITDVAEYTDRSIDKAKAVLAGQGS